MLQRFLEELYNFETQLKVSINFVCEVPWYLTTLLMKSKTELFTGGEARTICNFRVGGETDLLRRGRHFLFDLSNAVGVTGGFVCARVPCAQPSANSSTFCASQCTFFYSLTFTA